MAVGEPPKDKLVYLEFIVINAQSPYNAIISRPAIWRLQAIMSTIYLAMKFLTPHGISMVYGD